MANRNLIVCMIAIAGACSMLSPMTARANGSFAQVDVSRDTASAVLAIVREPLSFGAIYAAYEGGSAISINAGQRLELGGGVRLTLGPSLGATREEGRSFRDPEPGLKAALERYAPTSLGGLYLLGEANTANNAWFVLGQLALVGGAVTLEASRSGGETYDGASLAVSRRIGNGPASLRAGYRPFAREIFLGVSFNTF